MIGLVDCNNFYASCERIFRPYLENKPIIVLSNNDGCIIARSNEAKSLGFKMGEPIFKKRRMVEQHKVNLFSSNFALYGDISKRVFDVISEHISFYEIYSIDEVFLDFSNFSNPYEEALKLKENVKKCTGIPISIGISNTKTLSKVANHVAKREKNNIYFLEDKDQIIDILKKFSINKIWGIGRRYSSKLEKYGIYTAFDLLQCDEGWIRKMMNVTGLRMVRELKGVSSFDFQNANVRKKSICTSRSFSKEICDYEKLSEYISMFSFRCSEKLRLERSCTKTISVFINTNNFKPKKKQHSGYMVKDFDVPTSDSIEITKLALQCLKEMYRMDCEYKKAGVVISDLVPENQVQLHIFDSSDRKRKNKLMKAMDFINGMIGRDSVRLGSSGVINKWKIGKERLSPSYTTKWSDILQIKL